jgi:hypothetical protein
MMCIWLKLLWLCVCYYFYFQFVFFILIFIQSELVLMFLFTFILLDRIPLFSFFTNSSEPEVDNTDVNDVFIPIKNEWKQSQRFDVIVYMFPI